MGDKSAIEWTDATWNPIVGCSIVSPGCTNCYAMRMAARIEAAWTAPHYAGTTKKVNGNAVWTGKLALAPDHILTAPLRWRKAKRIFVNSMGDIFHEDAPDEWIDKAFAVMALCPQHTFQVLTKRAERMRDYLSRKDVAARWVFEACQVAKIRSCYDVAAPDVAMDWQFGGLPNVWLGVSAERQQEADERIPLLLQTPAAIRFVSLEPLLGPIDLSQSVAEWAFGELRRRIVDEAPPQSGHLDWIIVGGESGPRARPMCPDWARSLCDQCQAAGVPFFFKQWGGIRPKTGDRMLDQMEWDQFPEVTI